MGRIGRDAFGDQAIADLMSDGIDVAHVVRDPKRASGTALIFVAKNGENSSVCLAPVRSLPCVWFIARPA